MTGDRKLELRVDKCLEGYYALGNEFLELDRACFIRNREYSDIYDANHGSSVRAETPDEIDTVLEHADEIYAGSPHRVFVSAAGGLPAFEARLVVEGYAVTTEVQLVLEDELRAAPRKVEIRPAESDADWDEFLRLLRLDHEEDARKFGDTSLRADEGVTRSLYAVHRAKCPPMRCWIAHEDGVDCGFFSSWPGENGVGKVEDLFVPEEFRRRGIATALIARAVSDARERGAGPVVIGARVDDWPKSLYQRLGFRPILLQHRFHKQLPEP